MSTYFVSASGRSGYGSGGVDPSFDFWKLTDKEIAFMNQFGLQILNDLLRLEKPSSFQKALLDSLFAYSRSMLAKSVSDKLLYLFTALDSFLLKGENEPIQQNISERLACVVGANGAERRRIIQVVKEMYGRRSKFVHHNQQQVDDLDLMAEFLFIVWKFYFQVIRSHSKFKTKEEFVAQLEERRLSY